MFSAALYARVRFFSTHLHTRPRVQRASGIPCSLIRGRNDRQTSGKPCREIADVYLVAGWNQNSLNVIARSPRDEAIHLATDTAVKWIASLRSQ
jgi:hypothetical protein